MNKEPKIVSFVTRRKALLWLGSAGAAIFSASSIVFSAPTNAPACVVTPTQTEGPFFVDEKLHRSDIRVEPSDGSIKPGVPLALSLRLSLVGRSACNPLAGAIVDVWHCDAAGAYSDVGGRGATTAGKRFLRGYQVTDADGRVQFNTIYPGWYPGRTVHIHFKVRTNNKSTNNREITSQLYLDDALTDRVHSQPAYAARGQRPSKNKDDGLFRHGGRQLMLQVIENGQGYAANFDIGLKVT